jgi:ABC-type nitrate/sulfonate/bicarbonate transport system substrate-binding protein
MSPRGGALVAGAYLAATLVACGPAEEPARDAGAEPLIPVELGVRPFLYNAPLYIALEEGYFAEEGLDVRVHMISGHAATSLLMVDHGEIDVLIGGVFLGFFNAIDEGSAVRMVADVAHFAPDACSPWALVAQRDLAGSGRLGSPASLRGLRIDMNPNITEGYFVETYLRRGGLSLDDIEIAEVPLAARQEAMNRASIDMTAISEPWLSRILADGHVVHVNANEVVPNLEFGTLVFGRSLLTERREAGRRFVSAYLRGVRRYQEGKTPRNMELLRTSTELSAEELGRACWPSVRSDGSIETGPLQEFQRWGFEKGLVDRVLAPEEYFDPSFLAEARTIEARGTADR